MASKDSLSSSRPMGLAVPHPKSQGRHHSHSISLGAVNLNHRVTRRKSMTASAASSAATAIAAALNESVSGTSPSPVMPGHRRGLSARRVVAESTSAGPASTFASFMARTNLPAPDRKQSPNSPGQAQNVAVDGSSSAGKPVSTRHRSRRASEGSHLVRTEGKRSLVELRCDRCGKGYKHSSCLTKHMWEHDPAWAYTSKLLISKHQQVQLLEAATVLVNMNVDSEPAADAPRPVDSDRSSASPTVSGISELRDGLSSTETTPPPVGEEIAFPTKHAEAHHHFRDHSASAFSRSFQSVPSSSFTSSVPSYSPVHGHFRHSSIDTRPSTADTGLLDDDAAGLAAAVELCNFGTPRTVPVVPLTDVPPVPPLPAQYLGQSVSASSLATGVNINSTTIPAAANPSINASSRSFDVRTSSARTDSSTPTIYNPLSLHTPLSYRISDERDVKMHDIKEVERESHDPSPDDDDFDHRSSTVHMDDDDDGVFGRMEE